MYNVIRSPTPTLMGCPMRQFLRGVRVNRRSGRTWQESVTPSASRAMAHVNDSDNPIDPRTETSMDTTPLAGAEPSALALFALVAAAEWRLAPEDRPACGLRVTNQPDHGRDRGPSM